MKTVLIPSAGTGSRLGTFTTNVNKGQMTIGDKPVISYIIEKFKPTDKIIICLGYKGDYLKQVVQACYPDWNIEFVEVDKYEGEGSGPGYSIIKAQELIKGPFYFFCNDGIITDNIEDIPTKTNVILGSKTKQSRSELYRKLKVVKNKIIEILPKQSSGDDLYSYVGIAYIKDYKKFFEAYYLNPKSFIESGESVGLSNLKNCELYEVKEWYDTGNIELLENAKKKFDNKRYILEKTDESIWFFENRVIKFHIDKNFIKNRVARWNNLKNSEFKIPELLSYSDNIYSYKYLNGTVLSEILNLKEFEHFCESYFNTITTSEIELSEENKLEAYKDFYPNKTLKRIEDYLIKYEDKDIDCVINGVSCLPVSYILKNIDWSNFSKNSKWSKLTHGDFQMENIIKLDDKNYGLIDFRQDFGVTKDIGDIYYDAAKMLHSFYTNDHLTKEGYYQINCINNNEYEVDVYRTFISTEREKILIKILNHLGFNIQQVYLITCLVILSFTSLHTLPYSKFAFYLGKYMLNKWFKKGF